MFRQIKSGNAETIALTVGTDTSNLSGAIADVVESNPDKLKTGSIGIVLQDKIYAIKDGAKLVGPGSTEGTRVAGLRVVMMGTDAPNYNGGVIVWDKTDAEVPVSSDLVKLGSQQNTPSVGDACYIVGNSDGSVSLVQENVDLSTSTIITGVVEYCGKDDDGNIWIRIL